ncbi:bifunctional NAD(P)H-hydrate repair enzyme Nnr [Arthrobacter sp. Hiyo8]|nr:bifunctional NAD(P)H-hydrate repair enzyme Nnr [Arthrobacter sp. Hiyo8]
MISAFTGTQIRAAEQPLLDAGEGAVLMQRAAYGLANAVVRELRSEGRRLYGSSVAVLAGKGNNGGDGLFAAAMLARRGMRTTAVLTAGSAHPDALAAFRAAGGRVHVLDEDNAEELAVLIAGDDVVIDAILGTGARAASAVRPRNWLPPWKNSGPAWWWPAILPAAWTPTQGRSTGLY